MKKKIVMQGLNRRKIESCQGIFHCLHDHDSGLHLLHGLFDKTDHLLIS